MVDELEDSSSQSEDAYERAIRLAQIATRQQAERADHAWTEDIATPSHALPSEAITALLNGPLTTDANTLAQLDITPQPLRSALTSFVDAFNAYEQAAHTTFADSESGLEDPGQLLSARNVLLEASLAVNDALESTNAQTLQSVPVIDEHPTLRIDLTNTNRDYTKNYTLILDVGGSDAYTNNVGGNTFGDCANPQDAAALFDLDHPASPGDVDYFSVDRTGKWAGDACGKNGGGWDGAGLLVSGTGTDVYFELPDPNDPDPADPADFHKGINGGGAAGTGLLVEIGGNETYRAGSGSTNGGGHFGDGLLVDLSGQDTYTAGSEGTNGGGIFGNGGLIDADGDDTYTAGDDGTNGGGYEAGRGILVDLDGTDTYTAGNNGTNGGANGGTEAFLIDQFGHDTYTAGGHGTNGGATNGGEAALVDLGGDDTYTATTDAVNGGANLFSTAVLVDLFGADEWNGPDSCSDPDPCTTVPKGESGARITR